MKTEIKQATNHDAEAVLAYYTELLAEGLTEILANPVPTLEQEKEFLKKHDGQQSALFLAFVDGRVVGMSGYHIAVHPQTRHSCSLGISVAKNFRRHGIGSQLISAGEEWCRSKAIHRLEFEVIDGNPAVVFYQRLGFGIEGRKRDAIRVGSKFKDVIIMAKMMA